LAAVLERFKPRPKVFEKDAYKFSFYSNEHHPIHVHGGMTVVKPYSRSKTTSIDASRMESGVEFRFPVAEKSDWQAARLSS
jgi:hypothetical protein